MYTPNTGLSLHLLLHHRWGFFPFISFKNTKFAAPSGTHTHILNDFQCNCIAATILLCCGFSSLIHSVRPSLSVWLLHFHNQSQIVPWKTKMVHVAGAGRNHMKWIASGEKERVCCNEIRNFVYVVYVRCSGTDEFGVSVHNLQWLHDKMFGYRFAGYIFA